MFKLLLLLLREEGKKNKLMTKKKQKTDEFNMYKMKNMSKYKNDAQQLQF